MCSSRKILVVLLCAPLASCVLFSKLDEVEKDRRSVYKQSRSLPDLEIPPDLTAAPADQSLEVPGAEAPQGGTAATQGATQPATQPAAGDLDPAAEPAAEKAPGIDDAGEALAQPERDAPAPAAAAAPVASIDTRPAPESQPGAVDYSGTSTMDKGHILEVELDSSEQAWTILREFWQEKGLLLDLDDEQVGVQQTQWMEPETDEPIWTRYTILSEQGTEGKIELLITAEQITRLDSGWLPQEPNSLRGRQLAEELGAFFGKALVITKVQEIVSAPADADTPRLTEADGRDILFIPGDLRSSWEAVGDALDRAGLEIVEENREAGVYKVVSAGERYQVSLSGGIQGTEVIILSEAGVWKQNDENAGRILVLLRDSVGG